jgi:hypothetical protein
MCCIFGLSVKMHKSNRSGGALTFHLYFYPERLAQKNTIEQQDGNYNYGHIGDRFIPQNSPNTAR